MSSKKEEVAVYQTFLKRKKGNGVRYAPPWLIYDVDERKKNELMTSRTSISCLIPCMQVTAVTQTQVSEAMPAPLLPITCASADPDVSILPAGGLFST